MNKLGSILPVSVIFGALFAVAVHAETYTFGSPTDNTDLIDLANQIGGYAYRVALPIAVAVIIYAGLKFMLARGNPTQTGEAKKILGWAMVGVAVIVIGAGFITLIKDILGIA